MRVQNRVALALPRLPAAVPDAGVRVRRGSSGVLAIVTLSSPDANIDRKFLGNFARIHVQDELSRVAGVSAVTRVGSHGDYGMRVWLNTDRLAAYALNAADVTRVLREKKWEQPAKREDIGDLIVKTNREGEALRVRDVANVWMSRASVNVNRSAPRAGNNVEVHRRAVAAERLEDRLHPHLEASAVLGRP